MVNIIKTAVITGGAKGIGLGIADYFLNSGMNVVAIDIDSEAGSECEAAYSSSGRFMFVQADVSDEDSVRGSVQNVATKFGGIDFLINNAGIANPVRKPLTELSLAEWNQIISVNLTGVFLMSKYCAPYLEKSSGAIINIASTRALQSEENTEPYSASKGGILSLTHSLAVSFSGRIRVNCISPGWIEVCQWQKMKDRVEPAHSRLDCEQHPAGRVGTPEDIASLAAFLVSDSAGFITGQNFVIDGGMTKKMIYE
ncbi:glucose 1-dehydrogenase [Desulforegula conservatrix]|uniref:glucose 1-dehydrogenase n=1 Tax=Desulforegula conservatrix TaxID=153026 RepID=UPI0004278DC8|nr:glucose 1-dehydrogenase [Desulforegula conservatrix]